MDIEHQPLNVFIREAILRTAQGWFVALSFICNGILIGLAIFTDIDSIIPSSGPLILYVLMAPWPFAVLLFFVITSSPHYSSDPLSTAITAATAIAPYYWIYT